MSPINESLQRGAERVAGVEAVPAVTIRVLPSTSTTTNSGPIALLGVLIAAVGGILLGRSPKPE